MPLRRGPPLLLTRFLVEPVTHNHSASGLRGTYGNEARNLVDLAAESLGIKEIAIFSSRYPACNPGRLKSSRLNR